MDGFRPPPLITLSADLAVSGLEGGSCNNTHGSRKTKRSEAELEAETVKQRRSEVCDPDGEQQDEAKRQPPKDKLIEEGIEHQPGPNLQESGKYEASKLADNDAMR